jgi:hypothetical protein
MEVSTGALKAIVDVVGSTVATTTRLGIRLKLKVIFINLGRRERNHHWATSTRTVWRRCTSRLITTGAILMMRHNAITLSTKALHGEPQCMVMSINKAGCTDNSSNERRVNGLWGLLMRSTVTRTLLAGYERQDCNSHGRSWVGRPTKMVRGWMRSLLRAGYWKNNDHRDTRGRPAATWRYESVAASRLYGYE